MPITYVNAKEKTYYLHQGITKTRKTKVPLRHEKRWSSGKQYS